MADTKDRHRYIRNSLHDQTCVTYIGYVRPYHTPMPHTMAIRQNQSSAAGTKSRHQYRTLRTCINGMCR
eukprot:8556918-Pyramimonas_sp.AAC.1